ncbi:hypothetical protein [Rhizobium rhizogenes]|uniref:hypothetical protein n=1 Tax=Rhizobium rhizogenes TaxID=359 RepID=UPI00115DFDA7|nr:hypothetical protein [Rhizobium rhizogenes]TRB22914.1 hypothetical protein EXN70_12775 [Rhizobium rhizogenes]
MSYELKYPGGELQLPDAHAALQQIKYLERDGSVRIQILDPEGNEITFEQLGERALDQFRAS